MEFLDFIFNGANVIPTALLLFVVFYWIIVILGFLGTDFLDFDLDVDADTDLDVDATASADISWLNNVLHFFNLGRIPLMIWLSFMVLPLWIICINLNGLLGNGNFLVGLVIFIPSLLVSLFIAKFLTLPFVSFFQKIDEDSKKKEILGKRGVVTTAASHDSKGMAEINYRGSFLRFYILTQEGVEVKKGDWVLFIQMLDSNGVYLIEPYNSID
jgi:membrane protein implicated in regulation of membrane protease activity